MARNNNNSNNNNNNNNNNCNGKHNTATTGNTPPEQQNTKQHNTTVRNKAALHKNNMIYNHQWVISRRSCLDVVSAVGAPHLKCALCALLARLCFLKPVIRCPVIGSIPCFVIAWLTDWLPNSTLHKATQIFSNWKRALPKQVANSLERRPLRRTLLKETSPSWSAVQLFPLQCQCSSLLVYGLTILLRMMALFLATRFSWDAAFCLWSEAS